MWKNIPDDIEKYQGFVYIIRRKDGKYGYIGKKTFWKTIKLKPLKGKTNKRHRRKETDWKTYWSSNTFIQEDVKKIGEDEFERIILLPCVSKAMMSYFELYFQMKHHVLFDEYYLNGIINIRLGKNTIDKNEFLKILNGIENRK